MTLSTVITGQFNAGNPIPEGTDSILFSNLSDDDVRGHPGCPRMRIPPGCKLRAGPYCIELDQGTAVG